MYNDSCEDMVHEKLQKKVWKNHPLGYIISGKKRTVRAFTRQEIMDFWRTYYTAGRMLICAAGHIDEAGFQDQLERYFGDIPSGRAGNELTVPVYGVKHFRRFRDIEQVHLDIAMPGLTVGCSATVCILPGQQYSGRKRQLPAVSEDPGGRWAGLQYLLLRQ